MTAYVMNALGVDRPEADRLRKLYWAEHGTTLAGLMREHDVDPGPYLTDVHDISMDSLEADPRIGRPASRPCPGGVLSIPMAARPMPSACWQPAV